MSQLQQQHERHKAISGLEFSDVLPQSLVPHSEDLPLSPETARLLERLRLGYKPLWQRLEELRRRARGAARTATWLGSVYSVVVLVLMFALVGLFVYAGSAMFGAGVSPLSPGLAPILLLNTLFIGLFACGLSALALVRLFTNHKLYGYYYADAQEGLLHRGDALLYCDESFHLLLREARRTTAGWQAMFQPKDYFHKLEEQLDFCAHQYTALRKLADHRNDGLRLDIAYALQAWQVRKMFQIPGVIWGPMTLASIVVHPLWVLVIGVAFGLSPRHIVSQARLVALLDYLMGNLAPEIAVAAETIEPRPEPPQGFMARLDDWCNRQTRPWGRKLRAPE